MWNAVCVIHLLALAKSRPPLTNCLLALTKLQWVLGFWIRRGLFSSIPTSQMYPSCLSHKCHIWLQQIWNARSFVRKQFPLGKKTLKGYCSRTAVSTVDVCNVCMMASLFHAEQYRRCAGAERCRKCGSGASSVKISLLHQCKKQLARTKPAATVHKTMSAEAAATRQEAPVFILTMKPTKGERETLGQRSKLRKNLI